MHTVRYAEQQKRLLLCPRPIDQESSLKQYAGIKRLIESHRATAFASDQYSEILNTLAKSRESLLGVCTTEGRNIIIADTGKDHEVNTSHQAQVEEKEGNPQKAKRKPVGRLQVDFDFIADLDKGKPAKHKKRSRKSIETEIDLLKQLVFEVQQAKHPDGTGLSSVADFKDWIESKIKVLRQE